jgi:hypothetical protein
LDLTLDTTYTGKAMAALLHDQKSSDASASNLFWNTYNSQALPALRKGDPSIRNLPEGFERYYK